MRGSAAAGGLRVLSRTLLAKVQTQTPLMLGAGMCVLMADLVDDRGAVAGVHSVTADSVNRVPHNCGHRCAWGQTSMY